MYHKEFYSVREVSDILGVAADRLYEYLRSGHIRGSRLTKHSKWLIHRSELERLKGAPPEQGVRGLRGITAPILEEEDIREHRAPALRYVLYDPSTRQGHAYIVEEGVEKRVPVIFDPYRLAWKRHSPSEDR